MNKRPSLAASMKTVAADASPGSPQPSKPQAATRVGMKRLLIPVTPQMHKRLKLLAVERETTLEAITRDALEAYLSKHGSN